jgi:hypothetical protein
VTWLSFCARRPGPDWKQSYGTGDRTLAQIEGVVDHSMEGSMAGAYSVLMGPEQSSWTFSIPKVGEPIQHYSLKKIPWHAGLPGDRRQDTSLIGNLTLIGKEHEGAEGDPWTENQTHWSAKIDVACRALCPAFGANPPTLRKNMWEHRWLSATSCPSGRNPWQAKFALISSLEDHMALDHNADMETFKRMLAAVLNETKVQAVDDNGDKAGTRHPLSLYLYRIRQNEQHRLNEAAAGAAHGHPHQHGEAG